jgi:hypothetical protein
MFQAGDVAPSSDFLLQLLTLPGEAGPLLLFVGLHLPLFESPVRVGVNELAGLEEVLLALETPRPRLP